MGRSVEQVSAEEAQFGHGGRERTTRSLGESEWGYQL